VQTRAVLRVGVEVPVEQRLRQGTEGEGVRRGQREDRPTHRDDPHHRAILDEVRQRLGTEPRQPSPQREVRRYGRLRLQTAEVLDHVERGQVRTAQQ
jgi:hypothetical protein